MQSATEYIKRTKSAVQLLFDGVDAYVSRLDALTGVVFVSGELDATKREAAFAVWREENRERLAAARKAEHEFIAESFALDTLCGSILQVAAKGLEMYSPGGVPPHIVEACAVKVPRKYCVGRTVRSVPLGLIVYAARNQHMHFNDEDLREPSKSLFHLLATGHGYEAGAEIIDPAFDLSNPGLVSYAANVTSLMEWRTYEKYAEDMASMLGVASS